MPKVRKPSTAMNPTCTSKVACDGNVLVRAHVETGVCATCERTLKKRGKSIAPRGINYWEKGFADE